MTKNETWEQEFESTFCKLTKSKKIYECSMHIENTSGDFSWNIVYGGRTLDSPMVLYSVSKLFTTTCIFLLPLQLAKIVSK